MKIKLLLASGNSHKYDEFADFFSRIGDASGEPIKLLRSSDYPDFGPIEENGSSYEENAAIKARAWANFTGIPAIADDSGLEVRSMDWAPGIFSARAASGIDADRIRWLLSRLDGCDDRFARFKACIVIAFPGGNSHYVDYFSALGACRGNISRFPAGSGGFGYDPVFVPDGCGATFAEMGREEKSKISHRAVAMMGVAKMMPSVIKYYTARYG
jgi:XTP/dITP diphosphohydrolase